MRVKTYLVKISENELRALGRLTVFSEKSLEDIQIIDYPVIIQKKIEGYPLDIKISNRFLDKCYKAINKEKKS